MLFGRCQGIMCLCLLQSYPPQYNLTKVDIPVVIVSGEKDWLADPKVFYFCLFHTEARLLTVSIGHQQNLFIGYCFMSSSWVNSSCNPSSFISPSSSHCQVLLRRSFLCFRWGFHVGDCLMILTGIPKVCPVHHHFRSLISFFSRSCLVLSHSVVVKVVRPFEIQYSAQVSVDESL